MRGRLHDQMIRRVAQLPIPPEEAFSRFVHGLAEWWPPEYSWAADVLVSMGIEPREGGHCYEIGPFGFRCDWGTVLAWEAPSRLLLAWQVSFRRSPVPNLARASRIEIRFHADAYGGSQLEFEHREFARHGRDSERYRRELDKPHGWTYILNRFAAAVGASAVQPQ